MGFLNLIDNTSTTVSASTPGLTVDLSNHTTLRLASVGVPVRFKVCVSSAVGGDTGAVKLLDSGGNAVMSVLINNPAATTDAEGDWYWVNGYLPAAAAKYDPHYGGNTLGTLTAFSASVYEIDWTTDPITGSASMTLGALSVAGTGVGASADASITLDAVTVGATGVGASADSSMTLGAATVAGTGTVAYSSPTYISSGTAASGTTGTITPAIPASTAANDILLCVALNYGATKSSLSTANGFAEMLTQDSGIGAASAQVQLTVFWKRATGSDSAPVLTAGATAQVARIYRFAGCVASGNPWDVTTSTGDNGADANFSVAGTTTTVANTLVVVPVIGAASGGGTGNSLSGITNANLTSITNRDSTNYTPGGFDFTMVLITGAKATASAYAATTATWSSTERVVAAGTIALKP